MQGKEFHGKMHGLVFRGLGASRLGAVQTTVVWQFVVFHYPQLAPAVCAQIIDLQEKVNSTARNTPAMESAIANLLKRVNELDTGGR